MLRKPPRQRFSAIHIILNDKYFFNSHIYRLPSERVAHFSWRGGSMTTGMVALSDRNMQKGFGKHVFFVGSYKTL